MFDRIKGKKTAKKISSFFSENYDPFNNGMFSPKEVLNIDVDGYKAQGGINYSAESPETLKFINDITFFLNGSDRIEQLNYTLQNLDINDLIKWGYLIKEIIINNRKKSKGYLQLFYDDSVISPHDEETLKLFLNDNIANAIDNRIKEIYGDFEDDEDKKTYKEALSKIKITEQELKKCNPNPKKAKKVKSKKKKSNSPDEQSTLTSAEEPETVEEVTETVEETPGIFTETQRDDNFIKKLKKILDNSSLPSGFISDRFNYNRIVSADFETYKKIVSILPEIHDTPDNNYSSFIECVSDSKLIERCILDKNYRKKFTPKQLIKLQRYYDLSKDESSKFDQEKKDKVYGEINSKDKELENEIPNGAITFDPRYKNNKNVYYISTGPIENALGFATLHDIGVDNNQDDIDKPPVIEAHSASGTGGSMFEITHCFFRIKATELDTDSSTNKQLVKDNDKSITKRALKRKSYSFGFYPNSDIFTSNNLFGNCKLRDDADHYSQVAIARVCDNAKILKMDEAVHKYTKMKNYNLFFKNCTSFVSNISKEIGFRDISKMFGSFIFAPNKAAKNIISAWMSGKYNNDSKTTFKAPIHKMEVYDQEKDIFLNKKEGNKFYAKNQGLFDKFKFGLKLDEGEEDSLSFHWKKISIINMADIQFEDNDDISYNSINKYLNNFIGNFYESGSVQLDEFVNRLKNTLEPLRKLFALTEDNNFDPTNADDKERINQLINERQPEAKRQLNLLGETFKKHNNYRGFLFVKFLTSRLDAGLIELLILKKNTIGKYGKINLNSKIGQGYFNNYFNYKSKSLD